MKEFNNSLLSLGVGVVIGLGSLLLLLEVWPLIVLSGGLYLILKGVEPQVLNKEA